MFIHKGLSTAIRTSWLTTIRFHCAHAQHRTAILQSEYHLRGPRPFKIARNIEMMLSNNITVIQATQKELDLQRETVLKAGVGQESGQKQREQPNKKKLLQDYFQLYTRLMKDMEKCPLHNQWMYKMIGWYNMLPFYKHLLERLIEAGQQELLELVECMSQMKYQWDNPYGIIDQNFFKQKNISTFYKRLDTYSLDISVLRKIQSILIVPVNMSKRIFYSKYFNQKIDHLLKYLQVTDNYTLSDIIWLMNAYVRSMNDDEQGIALLEKYLIAHQPPLNAEDITLLMKTYELKGRMNKGIYETVIKPFILRQKMGRMSDLVEMVKFTICSESEDTLLLKNLYQLISIKYSSQKISLSRDYYNLHLYTHYLLIQGYKIKLPNTLEKELHANCKQRSEGRENASVLMRRPGKVEKKQRKQKYKSPCLSAKQPTIIQYEQTQKSVFQNEFSNKLRQLNLSDYRIYQKPVFCCFQLDYLLVNKHKQQFVDIQIEGIQYVFGSGRLIREREIRDEILRHYDLKINHIDYNWAKSKAKFDEDQILMNKRIRS